MSATLDALREELKDPEYSEGYAESFLDSYIATQIKVLREQAGLSQDALAKLIGTRQGVISRIENVNYSKWSVITLKKLARAFRVRLRVSFETYGSLLAEVDAFSRTALERAPREKDPILNATSTACRAYQIGHPHNRSAKQQFRVHASSLRNAPGHLQQEIFGGLQEHLYWQQYPQQPTTTSLQSIVEAGS